MIKPISDEQASDKIKEKYQIIKQALDSLTLPIFFTYISVFPEYFDYITNQLIINLNDKKFKDLAYETALQIKDLISTTLQQSDETQQWLFRYRNTPNFYNFQKDIHKIFEMNMKMAFIFVALREAVKGWAVAAKQLPSQILKTDFNKSKDKINDFVYSDIMSIVNNANLDNQQITNLKNGLLETNTNQGLEKNWLPEYLHLCRMDFMDFVKREDFLIMRLGIEKIILASLPLFPNLVFSPINVVLQLTEKYPDFSDLLFLLCEDFPTIAVQKLIFSGYMLS